MEPQVRVGMGGWTFEPWRDNFYPQGLPAARELAWAAARVTAIEVNGTFYSTMRPETYAKWARETPEHFVFALKASRYATNRRVLADAGESIARFVGSGIAELGAKLGPIVWQFAPTKRFDAADFGAFVALLPASVDGIALRHVLDVRHESFRTPEFLALARRHRIATVFTDSDDYPSFADVTGDFVYVREMRTKSELPQGCEPQAFDALAACARCWRDGGEPDSLPRIEPPPPGRTAPRDVFVFFISGAKERAPAAAMALLERLRAGA